MKILSILEMHHRIGKLLAQKRNYKQEVRGLTERYQYVVFYGCGAILNSIVETWDEHVGRKIDYCCDSDSGKWGKIFCGVKCLSPSELIAIKNKCVVFVTIGDFKPVYNFLRERGFPSVNPIYKYDLIASEFLARHDPEKIQGRLSETYEILEDQKSRNVFNAIVTRVLGDGKNINIMLDVFEKNQYFPQDLITLSEHERLVDIGAFNGDTIRDFIDRTHGKFDQIFSFEVSASNFNELHENVLKLKENSKIKIYNLGILDKKCEISYSNGQSQSTVGSGQNIGYAVALDNVLKDEPVTFIKMDIEGAEPQALRGATNIIRSQKPKLAICIYHDFCHLWEIPLYIKELVPGYKIYLRHHTSLEYETVCYAITSH